MPQSSIRLASRDDIPAIEALIPASVRGLSRDYYSNDQMEGAIGTAFGVDTRLIEDHTYFVVECDGKTVACGGWSRRRTLFGGDHAAIRYDEALNPATDAAKIRAFFVHPDYARRGIATLILKTCESAAIGEGFSRFEMGTTLPGVPFYRHHGYSEAEPLDVALPNGAMLPIVRMVKQITATGGL
ncbi:MAG: GNAT family N-acetyltransferase [Acidobacteriaceae bacterium]